ncbi:MAG: transposase [Pseudonocardiaceae bacterium]
MHYSVGFDFDARIRAVLATLPATAWVPALDAAGDPRDGAQLSLFQAHAGKRYQVIATNTPGTDIQFREAAHRTQARVEGRIRCGKNTGMAHMPSRDYAINQAWCAAVSLACDLLAWLRLLALTGDLATAEPTTLRYQLLHTAARIVRGQRRRRLRIPETWP